MKKEIVYTVDIDTEKGMQEAEELRSSLYEKYNSVQVYPNGLNQVRIVATDEI